MAEAIGAVSAVMTLVATAYTLCKNLHDIIKRIRNTPRSLYVLSRDLEDFYLVLGTLQSILDSRESTQGMLRAVTTQSLERALQDSVGVFSDINIVVGNPTKKGNVINYPVWKRIKRTFKEKEVVNLRKMLLDHKMTLNMAISVANMFVATGFVWSLINQLGRHILGTSNVATESLQMDITDIRERFPVVTSQLDDVRESQLPRAMVHTDADRAAVSTDYNFALRHYLDDAASIITEVATLTTPSVQISSLGTFSGYTSSVFWTAPTQAATDTRLKMVAEGCTQLLIIDLAQ